MILTDITEILSKDAAERHRGELLQLFQHMMRDKTGFLEFLVEADAIMRALKGGHYDSLDHLKRLIHTLKGNYAIFGMRRVSEICHEVEDEIAEQGEAPAGKDMAALDQAWGQIRPDIEKLIPALYAAFYDSVAAHRGPSSNRGKSNEPTADLL